MTVRDRQIRILHIFGTMDRGGAEMRTLELMQAIDRSRFHFDFCCLSGAPGELDGDIRRLGGEVRLMKFGLRFGKQFRRLLRTQRYDVVHSHVHHFSGAILRWAAAEAVPGRIAHYRSTADFRGNSIARRWYRAWMKTQIQRHATDILAVSEDAMTRGWNANWRSDARCQVIYNGFDLSAFGADNDRTIVGQELSIRPDERVCIHVGRASSVKNHPRLIEVFAELSRQVSPICLVCVGEVPDAVRDRLRQQAASLGCSGRVLFVGLRPDVPRYLAAADLMIFPSHWEGLPGAVVEALAAGLPVLASDLPVLAEVSRYLPGVHMLSLTMDNSVWVRRATSLLEQVPPDNQRRQALRLFSASPLAMASAVQQFESVYERCASKNRRGDRG